MVSPGNDLEKGLRAMTLNRCLALTALLTLAACVPPSEEPPPPRVPVVPSQNDLIRIFDEGLVDVTIDLRNDLATINNRNALPCGVFVEDDGSEVPQVVLSDAITTKDGPSVEQNVRGFYCGMKYHARVWLYNNNGNALLAAGLNLFGVNLYNEVKMRQWIFEEYELHGEITCASP